MALYQKAMGRPFPEKLVTSWHPIFIAKSKMERSTITREWLNDVAEKHPDEFSDDTSTSSDNNISETTSSYTTGPSDLDMLQLFHGDNLVPDEVAAFLIGEAKGRYDGTMSIPPNIVIEAKRTALDLGQEDPWLMEPYTRYVDSLRDNTSSRRERSELPPPESPAHRHSDDRYADNSDHEVEEMRKRTHAMIGNLL